MAKYEAIGETWLDFGGDVGPRLVKTGETNIVYNGWPNAALDPLDAEARVLKAVVAEYQEKGRKLPETPQDYFDEAGTKPPAGLGAKADKRDKVEIPANFHDLAKPDRINIAMKLGAKKGINSAAADKVIEKEVARREKLEKKASDQAHETVAAAADKGEGEE